MSVEKSKPKTMVRASIWSSGDARAKNKAIVSSHPGSVSMITLLFELLILIGGKLNQSNEEENH